MTIDHAAPFPIQVRTVSAMQTNKAPVKAVCQKCGLETKVDLQTIIKLCGPEYSLINKHNGQCRRYGCDGHVRFMFQSSNGIWYPLVSLPMKCRKCGLEACWPLSKVHALYGVEYNKVNLLTQVAAVEGCYRAKAFVETGVVNTYDHCSVTYAK